MAGIGQPIWNSRYAHTVASSRSHTALGQQLLVLFLDFEFSLGLERRLRECGFSIGFSFHYAMPWREAKRTINADPLAQKGCRGRAEKNGPQEYRIFFFLKILQKWVRPLKILKPQKHMPERHFYACRKTSATRHFLQNLQSRRESRSEIN